MNDSTIFSDHFNKERGRLLESLDHVTDGGTLVSVRHVGATSVPDLPAHPCIDIAVAVSPFPLEAGTLEKLERLGYQPVKEQGVLSPRRFNHVSGAYQLLICEPGSKGWADILLVSDVLRQDDQARREWVVFQDSWMEKRRYDPAGYAAAKDSFFEGLAALARRWWVETNGFTPVRDAARELQEYPHPWYVSGGWAIDLFLDRVTRFHQDVDMVIPRADQLVIQAHMIGRGWKFVTPYQKRLEPWPPHMRLELPRHQAHAHREGSFIDFLLTDFTEGIWHYRRSPEILRAAGRIGLKSPESISFLAPELVLLFKSRNTGNAERPQDQADFENVLPLFEPERRAWLRWALIATSPGHPWIQLLG